MMTKRMKLTDIAVDKLSRLFSDSHRRVIEEEPSQPNESS